MDGSQWPKQGDTGKDIARLWNRYVQASRNYCEACRATDAAQAACQVAHVTDAPCESAHAVCEAAFANEATWGRAVVVASEAFQAASDAAFLNQLGISTC